ncbi:DUF2496 domain-containing protein [Proteus myxofaciens]|uniref:Inner membrane protein n=1 Tax=Proteus myxofaciens ATCC 19692 TaxID=1354337 RepID=A0A198FLV9_9GAMM|nr:DUF2496 domain-containing protein [Proteus myxofaciens]OAT25439.1 hypothetical protein M983_2350 [Proteus myxofaciens ATCC 19692]
MELQDEPESVQLAVDIIYLLETHKIEPHIVLEALEIIRKDYEQKLHLKTMNK